MSGENGRVLLCLVPGLVPALGLGTLSHPLIIGHFNLTPVLSKSVRFQLHTLLHGNIYECVIVIG